MITVLAQATLNFVQHQLRMNAKQSALADDMELFHVSIDLTSPADVIPVDFYFSPAFVQHICMAMLGEEAVDDETILDLIGETTNQIAGSAKILADNAFDIGIPDILEKQILSPKHGTYHAFSIENEVMLCISY